MSNYYKERNIVFNKINKLVEKLPDLEEIKINTLHLELLTNHEVSKKAITEYLALLETEGIIKQTGGVIILPE
jgi:hypothetical protein